VQGRESKEGRARKGEQGRESKEGRGQPVIDLLTCIIHMTTTMKEKSDE
jgi:hypothetical protein